MANVLTPEQHKEFDAFIVKWQRKLGLNDWRVERAKKPSKYMAEMLISYPDRLAAYKVGDFGAAKVDSTSIEATALHELLHVLLAELVNQKLYGLEGDAIASAEHAVVNTLEKLLLGGPDDTSRDHE